MQINSRTRGQLRLVGRDEQRVSNAAYEGLVHNIFDSFSLQKTSGKLGLDMETAALGMFPSHVYYLVSFSL